MLIKQSPVPKSTESIIDQFDTLTEQESTMYLEEMMPCYNYISLEDIKTFSENYNIQDLGEIVYDLCEAQNLDPYNITLVVKEESIIGDFEIRNLVTKLQENGIKDHLKIIPYINKDMMKVFNEGILQTLINDDSSIIDYCDALLEGVVINPNIVFHEAKVKSKEANKAIDNVSQDIDKSAPAPNNLPSPEEVNKATNSAIKSNKNDTSLPDQAPSDDNKATEGLPHPDDVDKSTDDLVGTEKSSADQKDGPNLPDDPTPEPDLNIKDDKTPPSDDDSENPEGEDMDSPEGDTDINDEDPSAEDDQDNPDGNPDGDDMGDEEEEVNPDEPVIDETKVSDVQNAINKITQQAMNKPKNFIAKAVATLKKLQEKWLEEKDKATQDDTKSLIDEILKSISQSMDNLLQKIQDSNSTAPPANPSPDAGDTDMPPENDNADMPPM